jgi:hypothetical protein
MFNMKNLKNIDRDELLEYLGLQTKRTPTDWILPSIGLFGAGILVGAGIGLLMAPKSGAELREDLRLRLQRGEEMGAFPPSMGQERPQKTV